MLYLILPFLFFSTALAQDWEWQQPLPQGNSLYGVHALSPARVLLVGSAGTVLTTSDGGTSWDMESFVGGVTGTLRSIHAIDDNIWWAAGDSGALLVTTNAGQNWQRRLRPPTDKSLYDIFFADSARGWAVGDSGTILRTIDGGTLWFQAPHLTTKDLHSVYFHTPITGWACGDGGTVLHTTNGGTTWLADTSGTSRDLYAISFMDADTGIVAGEAGIVLRTTNGGATWTLPLVTASFQSLHSLKFLDPSFAYAIGFGTLVISRDAGLIWRNVIIDSRTSFHDVSFTDTATGWIAGNSGDIRSSTTGGRSWNRVSQGATSELLDLALLDAQNCVVVGAGGTILRTTNGGTQWTTPAGLLTTRTLFAVEFPTPQSGWAVGDQGTIIHTSDAGDSWALQAAPSNAPLFALQFIDSARGWAGGQGTLLSTIDGGAHWSRFPFFDTTMLISAVHFFSPQKGVVVASSINRNYSRIYRTVNGGATWEGDAQSVTANMRTLFFINENLGWAGGIGRTILHTTDGGASWTGQSLKVGSGYNSIFFADSANGWLVGRSGLLMRTVNGGQSWRVLATATTNFINKFEFSDPANGWAIGVNGTILRTTTGGGPGREIESPVPTPTPSTHEVDSITVYPNFPNPFNQGTWIPYELLRDDESFVLTIYDLMGKSVKEFVITHMPRGRYVSSTSALYWDGVSESGLHVPSGVYFYQLRSAKETITRKLLLVR